MKNNLSEPVRFSLWMVFGLVMVVVIIATCLGAGAVLLQNPLYFPFVLFVLFLEILLTTKVFLWLLS